MRAIASEVCVTLVVRKDYDNVRTTVPGFWARDRKAACGGKRGNKYQNCNLLLFRPVGFIKCLHLARIALEGESKLEHAAIGVA